MSVSPLTAHGQLSTCNWVLCVAQNADTHTAVVNRSEKTRFGNFIGPVESMRDLADRFGKSFLSSPYSPLCRSERLTGPVVGAFRERAHRKRTRLYVEDARPSETPWTRGMAAPQ